MRKSFVFDYSASLEALDLRLSPSSLLPSGGHTMLIHHGHMVHHHGVTMSEDEPLPAPEPSPGPNPGTAAPITPPPMPQVGPIGPGTS